MSRKIAEGLVLSISILATTFSATALPATGTVVDNQFYEFYLPPNDTTYVVKDGVKYPFALYTYVGSSTAPVTIYMWQGTGVGYYNDFFTKVYPGLYDAFIATGKVRLVLANHNVEGLLAAAGGCAIKYAVGWQVTKLLAGYDASALSNPSLNPSILSNAIENQIGASAAASVESCYQSTTQALSSPKNNSLVTSRWDPRVFAFSVYQPAIGEDLPQLPSVITGEIPSVLKNATPSLIVAKLGSNGRYIGYGVLYPSQDASLSSITVRVESLLGPQKGPITDPL